MTQHFKLTIEITSPLLGSIFKDETSRTSYFERDEEDNPVLYPRHLRAFLRDAATALFGKAMSKRVRLGVFIETDPIRVECPDSLEMIERAPWRVPMTDENGNLTGHKTVKTLAEAAPVGSTLECIIAVLTDITEQELCEMLNYGKYQGLGKARTLGYGQFIYTLTELDESELKRGGA